MSYIPNRSDNYINLKLTDLGRRQLTLGKLSFDRAVFSDREVNYSFRRNLQSEVDRNRTVGQRTDGQNFFLDNRILSPAAEQPNISLSNYDLTNPYLLTEGRLSSQTTVLTAMTDNIGFFTALNTGATTTIVDADYVANTGLYIISGTANTDFTNVTNFITYNGSNAYVGHLSVFRFQQKFTGMNYTDVQTRERFKYPLASLTYRLQGAGINELYSDRDFPSFLTPFFNVSTPFYTYPSTQSASTYYGSATTVTSDVWMMNIVRTSNVIGEAVADTYQSYGSIDYNGTKQYLGFEKDYRSIGIIHYTNDYNKNTYGNEFVAGTIQLDLPHILWHNYDSMAGKALYGGLRLTDKKQQTKYDYVAKTEYRNIADERGYVVGRAYMKLKIFVITDPELLNALSYKSNRNWTLPKPTVRLVDEPKSPLNTDNTTTLLNDGETLLLSYVTEADSITQLTDINKTLAFGYQSLHCGYIQKIDCQGSSKYVEVTFPDGGFPYLRNEAGFQTYSGTGWSSNRVKLIAYKMNTSDFTNINDINYDSWIQMCGVFGSADGNGSYSGESTHNTVDPAFLQAHKFIISQEDYTSGVTYTLGDYYTDYNNTGDRPLNIGDQYFFYGNVQVGIAQKTYKTLINLKLDSGELNESANSTFKLNRDDEAFVTEVGIINRNNELVAVGKMTHPVRKTDFRYLAFQLELDF